MGKAFRNYRTEFVEKLIDFTKGHTLKHNLMKQNSIIYADLLMIYTICSIVCQKI